MSRSPAGSPRINEVVPPGCRSSPQRVEEKYWSHFASRGPTISSSPGMLLRALQKAIRIRPPKASAGPCEPSRRLDDLGTTQAGRDRIDHSHAGFPQGSLTRRFSSYLVSYWLTNAIDRIVKEHARTSNQELRQTIPARPHTTCGGVASLSSTDAIGRCKAAFEQLAPAVD